MSKLSQKRLVLLTLLILGGGWCWPRGLTGAAAQTSAALTPEAKALALLVREVPAWPRENGCFSCHNNGDAARALLQAARRGYTVPAAALAATQVWLSAPAGWSENKGDPGFSDQRLATVQFAAALLTALETGQLAAPQALLTAARQLAAEQAADGSWQIDAGNALGSPATYGTPLATWLAWRVLQHAQQIEKNAAWQRAAQRAARWLRQRQPQNVPLAATLVLALAQANDQPARKLRAASVRLLRRAQTRDGGWGPYAAAPPEAFDTALALLALAEVRPAPSVKSLIQRGRQFLSAQQNPDGSWPATTRPSGGESYAQRMSTTGWAMLALLATQSP
jgi:hypothetical protein